MNKKWKTRVGWVFLVTLVVYVVLKSTLSTSFTSENFPLSEKWSTRLSSNIQQISIIDNQIVLVKTAAEIYALEIKSGKLLWHRATGYRLGNDEPALAKNGVVFFTDSKWVWAQLRTRSSSRKLRLRPRMSSAWEISEHLRSCVPCGCAAAPKTR